VASSALLAWRRRAVLAASASQCARRHGQAMLLAAFRTWSHRLSFVAAARAMCQHRRQEFARLCLRVWRLTVWAHAARLALQGEAFRGWRAAAVACGRTREEAFQEQWHLEVGRLLAAQHFARQLARSLAGWAMRVRSLRSGRQRCWQRTIAARLRVVWRGWRALHRQHCGAVALAMVASRNQLRLAFHRLGQLVDTLQAKEAFVREARHQQRRADALQALKAFRAHRLRPPPQRLASSERATRARALACWRVFVRARLAARRRGVIAELLGARRRLGAAFLSWQLARFGEEPGAPALLLDRWGESLEVPGVVRPLAAFCNLQLAAA